MSPSRSEPTSFTYIGLFLTTLSLLQLELFLTRIFSVTMWYHFAFMAISLAMFGLAAGAVLVEVMKKRDAHRSLANIGLLFALSSAVCFTAQLYIPADPESRLLWTAFAFVLISIPFVFAGMVVCVALTRFPVPPHRSRWLQRTVCFRPARPRARPAGSHLNPSHPLHIG